MSVYLTLIENKQNIVYRKKKQPLLTLLDHFFSCLGSSCQCHKLIKYVQLGDIAGGWAQVKVDVPAAAKGPDSLQAAAAGDKEEAQGEPGEEDSSECSPVKRHSVQRYQ